MSKPAFRFLVGALLLGSAATMPLLTRAQPAPGALPGGGSAGAALPPVEVRLRVPLFSKDFASTPVASVDGNVVTAADLAAALEGAHGQHGAEAKAGAKDFLAILQRLLDVRLLVAEARDSDIDKIPEVKRQIDTIEETRLKDILRTRAIRSVKVDKAALQKAYQDAVTWFRMRSLNFESQADAKLVAARMTKGASFADVARDLVAEKKARDLGEGSVPGSALGPVFGPVLRRTKPGSVTPPTLVDGVWVVAQLLEVKRKEDPGARAEVENNQLAAAREEALHRYYGALTRRYAKVDRKLLDSLDFDAAVPGPDALASDQRVIARLPGGKKITVANLAQELERHFFHGLKDAAGKKRIGPKVQSSFDSLLFRTLLLLEADRQGLRDSDEFRKPVRTATDRLLFEAFLKTVIAPTIQVSDEEVRKYYEAHKADYATPGMLRLDGLAFADPKSAEAALARLKAGTDFKWLQANADGVVPAESQKIRFDGVPVTASSLPEGLAKAISGAHEGDFRLYAGDGESYVVQVAKEFPSGSLSLDDARKGISDKLFSERVGQTIKEWADKVRPHHDVQVYLARPGE